MQQQLSRWNNEWLLRKITRAVDKELPDRLIIMIHACHADAIVAAAATFMPILSLLPPASPLQLLPSLPLLTYSSTVAAISSRRSSGFVA
jgi:hypothetical protein